MFSLISQNKSPTSMEVGLFQAEYRLVFLANRQRERVAALSPIAYEHRIRPLLPNTRNFDGSSGIIICHNATVYWSCNPQRWLSLTL